MSQVIPVPVAQFLDNSGLPLAGGKLYTYAAGTTTPLATYSDYALGTPNTNPVILDASGRAPIYLADAVYKFVLQTSTGGAVWTQDYVPAAAPYNLALFTGRVIYAAATVLTLSSNAVTPTQNVHALDTSGGAQNLNNLTIAGTVVPSFVVMLTGNNPGANPVTVKDGAGNLSLNGGDFTMSSAKQWITLILKGTTWYELARSAPALPTISNNVCNGVLTLVTGVPYPPGEVTAATSIYFTPVAGNRIALYDGAAWNVRTFAELSIALGADTANSNWDLFAYDNAGVVAIERLVWASDTARATNLVLQNGVLVKNADPTRRYLATYRTTAAAGQCEDSLTKCFVWNYYNRRDKDLLKASDGNGYAYTTNAYRQANANAASQVAFVIGWQEEVLKARVTSFGYAAGNNDLTIGLGLDSTTVNSAIQGGLIGGAGLGDYIQSEAIYHGKPAVGYHYLAALENGLGVVSAVWSNTRAGVLGGVSAIIHG